MDYSDCQGVSKMSKYFLLYAVISKLPTKRAKSTEMKWIFVGFIFSLSQVLAINWRDCPKSLEGWSLAREEAVSKSIFPDAPRLDFFINLINHCRHNPEQKAFFEDPAFQNCLRPIREMTDIVTFNKMIEKREHFKLKEDSFKRLPAVMRTEDFNKSLKNLRGDGLKREIEKLKKKFPKLDAIVHLDPFINMNTLFIRILGDPYDWYFHFIEGDPGQVNSSVIEKSKEKGKASRQYFLKLNPEFKTIKEEFDLQFKENLKIEQEKQGATLISDEKLRARAKTRTLKDLSTENKIHNFHHSGSEEFNGCVDCHRHGPIPILHGDRGKPIVLSSSHNKKLATDQEYVDEFNNSLAELGKVDSGQVEGTYKNYGPPIGLLPEDSGSGNQALSACLNEMKGINKERVLGAMKCQSCHNGVDYHYLQFPLGTPGGMENGEMFLKMSMKHGNMPPGNDLSQLERNALSECLLASYFGTFKKGGEFIPGKIQKYLTAGSCLPETKNEANLSGEECENDPNTGQEEIEKVTDFGSPFTKIKLEGDKTIIHGIEDDSPPAFENNTIVEVLGKNGSTVGYRRKIRSNVCPEGLCLLVDFELVFDKEGKVLGLGENTQPLTKRNHDPFTKEDYKKLVDIISDDSLKLPQEPYDLIYSKEDVDGVTGATKLSYQDKVVPGAAYTTLKIKQYVDKTRQKIQKLKR